MVENKLKNIDSNIINKDKIDSIKKALEIAESGSYDGAHHKMWVIDQIVRALTLCPMVTEETPDHFDYQYTYEVQGESEEYEKWVKEFNDGEDGPETYEWDVGIAP